MDNLYVTDTGFFPGIGAVNPALSAMANAIRAASRSASASHSARQPRTQLPRKDAMKNRQSSSSSSFQLNTTPVFVGAALIGAGSLIGLTGLILGGTVLVSATRKWLRELEVPPTEVVKHKLGQTRAATAAGASAWKHHQDAHHYSSA